MNTSSLTPVFARSANRLRQWLPALLVALLVAGCGPGGQRAPESAGDAQGHAHAHTPPHGGAPVLLGDHAYHLEFVLDAATGDLSAYALDGHLENFIRLPAEGIDVVLKLPAGEETLRLLPVASAATGETVGDTAHFQARSPALIGQTNFNAVVSRVDFRGRVFENVAFNYPKGNE